LAFGADAKPFVAQGYLFGQTANLQEWQDPLGNPLTVVDAGGRLGVGTGSPVSPLEVVGPVNTGVVKLSSGTGIGLPALDPACVLALSSDYWTAAEMSSHHGSGNPSFTFDRSRGTRTSPTTVAADDYVGGMFCRAYDGSAYRNCAGIRFQIDGAPGANSLPTRAVFYTSPSGSFGLTERMRITNAGNVGIRTTTPTGLLDVKGSTGYNQLRMETSYTPTGTGDTNGNTGDLAWDSSYVYLKTGAGWKRAALSTF
jgi:hypothetical protein